MTLNTIAINISEDIDAKLDLIANETGQDKLEVARLALIEWIEDREDARDSLLILEQNEPSSSIQDVRKRLGLGR